MAAQLIPERGLQCIAALLILHQKHTKHHPPRSSCFKATRLLQYATKASCNPAVSANQSNVPAHSSLAAVSTVNTIPKNTTGTLKAAVLLLLLSVPHPGPSLCCKCPRGLPYAAKTGAVKPDPCAQCGCCATIPPCIAARCFLTQRSAHALTLHSHQR